LQEIVVFGRRKLEKIFLKVKQLKIKNNHKEIGINEIINTTRILLFSCGFSCRKKSAGIPKDFLADFAIKRHFLRI
jgi:hypothetical protein